MRMCGPRRQIHWWLCGTGAISSKEEGGNFCLLAELRWSRDRWVHWVGNTLCPTLPAKSVLVPKLIPAIDALPHILRRAFYLFAPLSQLESRLRVRDEESLWSVDRPFLSFCQSLS